MDLNLIEMAKVFAAANLAPVLHFHEGSDIHDNGTVNFCPNATPSPKNEGLPAPTRLSLFIHDPQQLKVFISDLSVCTSTSDICLAVDKLCGGKVASRYTEKNFASAILPHLKFETTADAVYYALYRLC